MIEQGKTLELKNLLSLRKKMNQLEINEEMQKIGQVLKDNNIQKSGPVLNTTFGVEMVGSQQVLDMEILIPIDKKFNFPEGYVFKEEFKLVNALYVRQTGNPMLMQNTYNELNQFIQQNKLQPITSSYNIAVTEVNDPSKLDEAVIDVYIGVSPNRL